MFIFVCPFIHSISTRTISAIARTQLRRTKVRGSVLLLLTSQASPLGALRLSSSHSGARVGRLAPRPPLWVKYGDLPLNPVFTVIMRLPPWMVGLRSFQQCAVVLCHCRLPCSSPQSRRSAASPFGERSVKAMYGGPRAPQSRHSAASPRGGTQCSAIYGGRDPVRGQGMR